MRECCKDDDQSQWEKPKFDPPPPINPLTDRHRNLPTCLRRGYLSSCKISSRSDKGFRFCACAISRIKLFTRLFVFLVLQIVYSQDARTGFDAKYDKKTRFRARMSLLGVAKPKVKLHTPFCPPKPPFWGPFSTGLSLENAFNIGHVLYKRPLIVIVAP